MAPPPIGSIAGRAIDEISGEPLPGRSTPFAVAVLLRCDGDECSESVIDLPTDEDGRFRFEQGSLGQPLLAGTYQIVVFAEEYEDFLTDPFEVSEDEDLDLGDLALGRAALAFSNIQPCEDLSPQHHVCRYSVVVKNNTNTLFRGLAWSLVEAFDLPTSFGYTQFEASSRAGALRAVRIPVVLAPSAQKVLRFRFKVPKFALEAELCAEIFLGKIPAPLLRTVRSRSLFCIGGSDDDVEVASVQQSQKIGLALSGPAERSVRRVVAKARK